MTASFYTPSSRVWKFQFLHILANTCYCLSFWSLLSLRALSVTSSGFCISLRGNDVEYFYKCPLSSLEKFLSGLLPIFKLGCVSLFLSCESSLCILGASPLSDVWFANIFFYMGCIFIFLMVTFETQKFLILRKFTLCFFFFWSCVFLVSYLRRLCLIWDHEDLWALWAFQEISFKKFSFWKYLEFYQMHLLAIIGMTVLFLI